MLTGLRGLAQSFVRSAVRVGLAVQEAYTTISTAGLGYVEQLFHTDYDTYTLAYQKVQQLVDLDKDYLVPGDVHSEATVSLSTTFKYDVALEWETIDGKIIEQHTSISSNIRMTQAEIEEVAVVQMRDYTPEDGVFHGEYQIEGAWVKAGEVY